MTCFGNRLTRVAAQSAVRTVYEALESRVLMSGTPAEPAPSDVEEKMDARFYQVAVDVQRGGANDWLRNGIARADSSGRIESFIRTAGAPTAALDDLRRLGAVIEEVDSISKLVQAWVPASQFQNLASLDEVIGVDAPTYAVSNTVTSAGDGILNADKVRAKFAAMGIDGTGIKVGVISDGAQHAANVGAELPAITIDPLRPMWNSPGNHDEGTAMLEIVHDLAPGAQLYFSGPDTSAEMVASINWLVGQGCNVIVDDLGFYNEGFFTDTSIATAAANAVSQGVVYVSAAGNASNLAHYQAQYQAGLSAFGGGTLHRFGAAGQDVNEVNIPAGGSFRAFLEWSDAWGASGNDYDLYLYDGDSFSELSASKKLQNGNDNPWESVNYTNNTGKTVHAQIWIVRKTGAASRELELYTTGNTTMQFQTPTDAIFGQQAVPSVITVAAAGASSPDTIESYSSRGDSTIYTNFTTQTKVPRHSLDGTAIDGVQTQAGIGGYFGNGAFFFGTSAAAPHAAAIAALIRQVNPNLTPAQVAQVMADTAVDLTTYGVGYDTSSGAGRYDALAAVYAAYTPAAPDLTAATDSGTSSTDDLTNITTPTLTGTVPAGSFVRLFVDGALSATVQLAANATTYSLQPGAPLGNGGHAITIQVAANAAVPVAQNSNKSPALNVVIDTVAPTIQNTSFSFDAPGQRLIYIFSEQLGAGLQIASLQLQNLTTASAIPSANSNLTFPQNHATFTFAYNHGALPDGDYHATLAGVTDAAGNALSAGAGFDFFVLAGDANLDRKVDFNDLVSLAQNYNTSGGMTWAKGDFTADGNVDFNDLVILAQRYNTSLPSLPMPAAGLLAGKQFAAPLFVSELKSNRSIFNVTTKIKAPTLKAPPKRR